MNKLKTKLVSFLLAFVFCTYSFADTHADKDKYNLKWTQMPIVCSSLENTQQYLDDYEFKVDKLGVGRENARPEGNPVYTVAVYKNDNQQLISVLMVPGVKDEVCMLFRVFNVIEYTSDGEIKENN